MVTRIFLCDERTEPDIRLYIKEAMEDIAQGDRYIITWSCSNVQSIKVGDQAYFQRVGFAPEGYFAHGQVVAADREYQLRLKYPRYRDLSEAYDIDFYPNNFRIWVAWDSCVDYDRPLPIDELRKKSQFRGAFFDAPDSGVVFKEQYVPRLDRAWDRHSLNSARQGKGIRLVDIYYAWAQEDSQQGFMEEALDNYALAIETQSDYIRAYIGRGNLYYGLKEFDSAIADYTAASGIRSKLAKIAFYQRGQTYSKLGQHDKAAADYNEALQIDFEYPEAHFGLANAFFKLKEYEKSVASYTQALNLNPKNAQAFYRRGRCYFILKQLNEAISDYDRSIDLKNDYADAFYYRAVAYSQPELGKDQLAINDLEKAAQLYREQGRLDRYDRAADLLETIAITAKEKARAKAAQTAQVAPGSTRRSPEPSRTSPVPSRANVTDVPAKPTTAAPGRSTSEMRTSKPISDNSHVAAKFRPDADFSRRHEITTDQSEPEITVAQYVPPSPEEVWGNEKTVAPVEQAASSTSIEAVDVPEVTAVGADLISDRLAQIDAESVSDISDISNISNTDNAPLSDITAESVSESEAGATEMPEVAIAMPASSGADDGDDGLETEEISDQEEDVWQTEQFAPVALTEQSEQFLQPQQSQLEQAEQSDQFDWLEREIMGGNEAIATPAPQTEDLAYADRSDYSDYLESNHAGNTSNISAYESEGLTATTSEPPAQTIAIDNTQISDREVTDTGEIFGDRPAEFTAPEVMAVKEITGVADPRQVTESSTVSESRPGAIDFADFDDELPLRTGSYEAIERAALVIITSQYIRDGWSVRSVEKSKRGYDLACRKDGTREDVSVRGVAGRKPAFELNADEIREAEYNDNFVLWVVSSALGNYACQRWSGKEVLVDFDLKPTNFLAKPKV
jgi:tetratricopeptide (TPR) repeat protein